MLNKLKEKAESVGFKVKSIVNGCNVKFNNVN